MAEPLLTSLAVSLGLSAAKKLVKPLFSDGSGAGQSEDDSLIGSAVSGLLGGIIEERGGNAYNVIAAKIKEQVRSLDAAAENHNLQKAARVAYLQATRVLCEARVQEIKRGLSLLNENQLFSVNTDFWLEDFRKQIESQHWSEDFRKRIKSQRWVAQTPDAGKRERLVHDVMRDQLKGEAMWLREAIRYCKEGMENPAPMALDAESLLQTQTPVTTLGALDRQFEESAASIKASLKSRLVNEVSGVGMQSLNRPRALSTRFRQMLDDGWRDAGSPTSQATLEWYELLCAFFAYDLNHKPELANTFQNRLLLKLGNQQMSLKTELDALAQTLRLRFDDLERKLNARLLQNQLSANQLKEVADTLLPRALARMDGLQTSQTELAKLVGDALIEWQRRPFAVEVRTDMVHDRVDSVMSEYFELFVGREDEIAALEQFIADNPKGFLTITAPAGFGKSALLANWIRRLRLEPSKQDAVFVAYHFFRQANEDLRSINYCLQYLLKQLYVYYQKREEVVPAADKRYELRNAIYTLVKNNKPPNQRLVVVIDSLDEAEDAFEPPFPAPLPDGLYVIVSARAGKGEMPKELRSWSHEAQPLHLLGLKQTAIAEWLRQAGDGELRTYAMDEDFIAQLLDVTGVNEDENG